MIWKYTYLLILFTAALAGCVRPLDLDVDTGPSKLAVICNFSDSQALEVVVSSTRSVLNEGAVSYVSDARVEVFEQGQFIEELEFIDSEDDMVPPRFQSQILVPKPGVLYMIQVHAPGFESVTAYSTIPPKVSIDTGTVMFTMQLIEEDLLHDRADFKVSIRITDPSTDENFYHLNFYQEAYDYRINIYGDTVREQFFSLPLRVEPLDWSVPMIPYFDNRGVLMKDDTFSGQTVTLGFQGSFRFRRNDQLLGDFIIELRSVSREYYLYHSALARQQQSGTGLFVDPVILFNNIENGQGVFAGYSSQFFIVYPNM